MSAEYSGKIDADVDTFTGRVTTKTIPVLPRPLTNPRHRIRALNLTGDESGALPTDDGTFWHGGTRDQRQALEAQVQMKIDLDAAIDAAWYD